ncbi:MAG: AI-2E family transporter, partial [Candidatus Sulfotelmatobacter sp.]
MSRSRPDSPALNPLVVLAGVILILYFARAVLIPLALAVTLNFLLTPMVLWFQKLGLRRGPAVALVMLISVSVVAGVGWVVTDQLLEVASNLPKYRLHIHNKIEALHFPSDSALGRAADSVTEIGKDFDSSPTPATPPAGLAAQPSPAKTSAQPPVPVPVQVVAPPAGGLQYLSQMLGKALVPLGTAGMVLIFTVFILVTQVDLRNRVLRLAGVAQLNTMTLALDDAANRVSRYLVVQFLVNASYGLCFGTGLFLIGIPNAILWGIFAGVFRIVPYAGVLTATAFPLVLSLAL